MTVSVDLDEADSLLRQEWARVLADVGADDGAAGDGAEVDYVDDDLVCREIRRSIRDDRHGTMTFKYMFLSSVLAKATNPDVHYRAVKTTSDLDGAFSSRSVAERVIVDWEQDNGQRLGGSNEPGTSKPFRWDEFSEDYSDEVLRSDAYDRLTDLLARLQDETRTGELDPVDVLRQTLSEVARLESRTIDFTATAAVPYRELEEHVRAYLEETGGGERLVAVTAGVLRAYYAHAGDGDWAVEVQHVNVPDEQSDAAGDVEVYRDGDLRLAVEVKDKPVARNDLKHSIRKAQQFELGEYRYLVGDGFADGEAGAATREAASAPVEMVLWFPDDLYSQLKSVGQDGRRAFVNGVSEYLNEMRALDRNKDDWRAVVEQFDA